MEEITKREGNQTRGKQGRATLFSRKPGGEEKTPEENGGVATVSAILFQLVGRREGMIERDSTLDPGCNLILERLRACDPFSGRSPDHSISASSSDDSNRAAT